MKILILSVGSRPKTETSTLIQDFIKRLPEHIHIEWRYIKHGSGTPSTSKQQEAESILRAIPTGVKTILLDEKGKQLSSPELSKVVFENGGDIVFIIGGAYGVDETISKRAQFVWSLGKLVYPHQLVRIIIAEQLYRAHSINTGHPYHHS